MILRSLGHAKFLLELASGYRIVTDPYDESVGYPVSPLRADLITVSHHHHDHDAVQTVEGWSQVLDTPGVHHPNPDVTVTMYSSFHDDQNGTLRGNNLITLIEAEGLRTVHMGDIGHELSAQLAAFLHGCDILLIPVGGYFTVDAATAKKICDQLNPRIIVPMHYKTSCNASWPISDEKPFLSLFSDTAESLSLLRIAREDMVCQPKLCLLHP